MVKQINITVPEELHKAVKVKAAQENRTVTGVIREFLRRWVEENEHERGRRGIEVADRE